MDVLRRFGFRFGIAYIALYVLPFPLTLSPLPAKIPGVSSMEGGYERVWYKLANWVGHAVFHLDRPINFNPAFRFGDTTFEFLRIAIVIALATIAAGGWSFFDRKRRYDHSIGELLRLALRYYLASVMFDYGLAKLGQFPSSSELPEYMVERYGDSSPMRLLWAFMGYSTGYKIFAGIIEILSGALLLFRRATTLGSLVGMVAISNVAMLNFSYDVGLKFFTCQILIFLLILIWPDRHRLMDFFLRNRATAMAAVTPLWSSRWLRSSGAALKTVLIGGFVYMAIADPVRSLLNPTAASSTAIELQGVFEVKTFSRDNLIIPAWTDPTRWQVVTFTPLFRTIGVHLTNGDKVFYGGAIDAADGSVTITKTGSTFKGADTAISPPIVLKYARPSPNELTLEGVVGGAHLTMRLHRSDLLLLSRGFHWINEGPYNR